MKYKEGKQLIVIGDRLLVQLEEEEKRTQVGLYLPPTTQTQEEVVKGEVIQVGQGIPLIDPSSLLDSPWRGGNHVEVRFVPMQVQKGDSILFLKKAGIEIQYEHTPYMIVSQSAVLVLLRNETQLESPFVADEV